MNRKRLIVTVIGIILTAFVVVACKVSSFETNRINRMKASANFQDKKFINQISTEMDMSLGKMWDISKAYMKNDVPEKTPINSLPIASIDSALLNQAPAQDFRYIWLGHSTFLLEIEGKRFLIDPVFSQRTSFVQWVGPKRFFQPPIDIADLPTLDAVIISHDHYDHLDKRSIQELGKMELDFYLPLGVGNHLQDWKIAPEKIHEFDWWEETQFGDITVACTPARHFSGRGLFDRNETLWASWTFIGQKHRIFYSGDTGIMPAFKDIGDKYGPFDLSIVQVGAYDEHWHDIHLFPEEAVEAQKMLRGKMLIPVHWATFDLALHSWFDPAEQLVHFTEKENMPLMIPQVGEFVTPENLGNLRHWWREVTNVELPQPEVAVKE